MTADARTLAGTYFRAWKARDFATLRSVLADDAESCVEGLRRMSEILADIVVHKVFVDGADVLTWFDLHTTVAPPTPVANWSHVEDGRIARIRVTFDARGLRP